MTFLSSHSSRVLMDFYNFLVLILLILFQNYFLDSAKKRNWDYRWNDFTDQPVDAIIQQTIKARFLDNLPQEIPYSLEINIEHVGYCQDDSMYIVVNARCPSLRIARMIIGKAGNRIKKVAKESEQNLCTIFQTDVKLKIAIPVKEDVMK